MLCAVAFMPPDNVIAGFEELSDLIRDTYQGEMDDYWTTLKKPPLTGTAEILNVDLLCLR